MGTLPKTLPSEIEDQFPRIVDQGYKVTSVEDKVYNCAAWAAKWDKTSWWQPRNEAGCYWPTHFEPDNYSLGVYTKMFEFLGYEVCDSNIALEIRFEKIAIYIDPSADPKLAFSHVAKQLWSGEWTSKLGDAEDISHKTIEAVEREDWQFVYAMKRIHWAGVFPRVLGVFLAWVRTFRRTHDLYISC